MDFLFLLKGTFSPAACGFSFCVSVAKQEGDEMCYFTAVEQSLVLNTWCFNMCMF